MPRPDRQVDIRAREMEEGKSLWGVGCPGDTNGK